MEVTAIKDLVNTESLKAIYGYFTKMMPEVGKYVNQVAAFKPGSLKDVCTKKEASDSVCGMDDVRAASVLALEHGKDIKYYVEFMVSLHALCHSLGKLLEAREMTDIGMIRQLYLPLSDSIDPDNDTGSKCECFGNTETGIYLKRLSDACREKVAALPSYKLAAGKMKKYIKLYIELQSCKYQPLKTRRDHLHFWSEYYMRQFPDISFWEFSASADSMLGICSMFISAADSRLTEDDVTRLDNAYLPWVCAYQKLLHYYVSAREDLMTGQLNFTEFYKNLKHCEERLKFFYRKSLESCVPLHNSRNHSALVKALPVIYLSNPKAYFGLNKLASRSIFKESSTSVRVLWNCNRLFNAFK